MVSALGVRRYALMIARRLIDHGLASLQGIIPAVVLSDFLPRLTCIGLARCDRLECVESPLTAYGRKGRAPRQRQDREKRGQRHRL